MTYFGIIIHICIHTYIHSILANIHTDVYVCMLVYVCICMHAYVCMHVYVCMYMYVCICMCVCMCVYVCVYVCMYVCVCIHLYLCMHNIFGGKCLTQNGRGNCRGGGEIVRGELARGNCPTPGIERDARVGEGTFHPGQLTPLDNFLSNLE